MSVVIATTTCASAGGALGFAYNMYFTDLSNMDDVPGVWLNIAQGAFCGALFGLAASAVLTISF
jgi:hypothetical protein